MIARRWSVAALVVVGWLLIGAGGLRAQAPQTLSVDRAHVLRGQTVTVRWNLPRGQEGYLSGVGVVSGSGSRAVAVDSAQRYVLLVDAGTHYEATAATVDLGVAKGGEDFPPDESFRLPYAYVDSEPSGVRFLERVHALLQDTLHHSVHEYTSSDAHAVFATNLLQRDELVAPHDPRVARRRIAYRVAVAPRPAGAAAGAFTVEAMIEYQLLREHTWRPENDATMYERQARLIADALRRFAPPPATGAGR